jgi:ABC-type multidrug transport system ATPase subunit
MVILEAAALRQSFGLRPVLRGVDLRVAVGERVAIFGENGSGKSTLLLVLARVLALGHGSLAIQGTVGFAPERPDLPDHLVVAEWLDLIASLKGLRRRGEASFRADALSGIKLGALSMGQRQRVSLACAWLGDPSLLLLDEPTNALDTESREELAARLSGATAVIATHDPSFAERVATRRLTMRAGLLLDAGAVT